MTHRPALTAIAVLALAALGALGLAGCGQKSVVGSTAQETADGFAAALETGKLGLAATAFDYVQEARRQNSDWDDIPAGQRDLIVKKLTEERAGTLGGYVQRLGAGIKAGPVAEGGVSSLTGDSGSMSIELRETEGKWHIYNVW